jgi:uncharacterized membrane protein
MVGGFIRTAHFGADCLWLDEIIMLITWQRPLVDSLLQRQDYSAPLYQLLLRVFVHQPHPSEALLRTPALVCGVLSIAAVWWLARLLFGRLTAALASLFMTFNLKMVEYSQEARPYTMWVFLATLSLAFFYRFLRQGRQSNWWSYVIVSTVMVYSHYFGVFLLAAQATFLAGECLWGGLPKSRVRRVLFALVTIVVLITPALFLAARYALSGAPGTVGWIERPSVRFLFLLLSELVGIPELGLFSLVLLLAAIWPGRSVLDRREGEIESDASCLGLWWSARRSALYCLVALLLTYFTLGVESMIGRPLLLPRYVLTATVPLLILGVAFLASFSRPVTIVAATILIYLQVPYTLHPRPVRPGVREIVQILNAEPDRTRPILITDWSYTEGFISPEATGLVFYGLVPDRPQFLLRTRWPKNTLVDPEALNRPEPYDIVNIQGANMIPGFLRQARRDFTVKYYYHIHLVRVGAVQPAESSTGSGSNE